MKNKAPYDIPDIPRNEGMTTQEYAYLRVRNAVLFGAVRPGTALTIRGLADTLGLSQTPIRETLRRLSAENAIEVLGNRRLKIPEMSAGRFEELVQLRIVLETHAAERSLPYVSDIIIENMESLDTSMDKSVATRDFDELICLNQDFHRTLYSLNPNQAVMPLIESVWLQMGPFQRQVLEGFENYYAVDRHKELLAALRSRDVIALIAAVESDIRDGTVRSGRALLRGGLGGTRAA